MSSSQEQTNQEFEDLNECEVEQTVESVDKLQKVMNSALELVGHYKGEIDELKERISEMRNIVAAREVEDKERILPVIDTLTTIYREEFSKLIAQNKSLEAELTQAIADKQEVIDQIYTCVDQIKSLEAHVFKNNNPPYIERQKQQVQNHNS